MNLANHIIIIFILLITSSLNPIIAHSKEKLKRNCNSLQHNFTSPKIYFEQCGIEELDKAILIKFFVYTYNYISQKNYWKYHPRSKEFKSICRKEPPKLCKDIYKLYIWSDTSIKEVEKNELLDQKYTILSKDRIKKNNCNEETCNYIEPSKLNWMRLAKKSVSEVFIEINELCEYVYFDSDGYAYVQYCPDKRCCNGIPNKPDISPIQRKQGNQEPEKPTINLPNYFKTKVTIDDESFPYYVNYGYVKFNKIFSNNNSIIPSDSNSLIMRLISQGNEFVDSPIQCESKNCEYSLPKNKSFSKKVIVQVDSSTKKITPVAILNDSNVLNQLKQYSKRSEQEINYYNDINGFIEDYKALDDNSKKEFLFFIENPQFLLNFPSIPDIPKTLILDEAKGTSFCTDTQDICFQKSDNVLNLKASEKMNIYTETYSNQWDDQFKYYRTPILHTNENIFQSIENELFKRYICKSSKIEFCYKTEMDKFGFWLIVDDFKHDKNKLLKVLHEFKVSDRFHEILVNAHNKKFRIDRIQGYRIEQIFDIRKVMDSEFSNISELEALISLNDHKSSGYNNWELHLILGRNTSKRTSQENKKQIMNKLDRLSVKRIILWEFSDTHTSEKTIYNDIFEDIKRIKKWRYKYFLITDKSKFNKISIPLYQN